MTSVAPFSCLWQYIHRTHLSFFCCTDEAGNYLSLTNSTFEFLKLAGGVLSYEFNSVDNSGRYWRTMERNLASSSKRNVASKLSTASIKRKSLMMEAVNVMDKQFEAIMEDDGDTSTYSSTSSAGFISTVVFFSLSFTLYPLAFTLAMILGSNSLVWIGSIIVALFVGSFLSACTLAEWGRDEGVQAIMNYYEGRTVKWFNYLPMLLDLATIALSTFDTALLAPYIGDEYGNLGAVVSLWAAVYSPGALLKHVDVSSYLIGACMNSLLIAITLLAACDITSKFVRYVYSLQILVYLFFPHMLFSPPFLSLNTLRYHWCSGHAASICSLYTQEMLFNITLFRLLFSFIVILLSYDSQVQGSLAPDCGCW